MSKVWTIRISVAFFAVVLAAPAIFGQKTLPPTQDPAVTGQQSPDPQQQQQGRSSGPVSLRAPAPGLVTEVRTVVGAPASPQAGPMFRIAINNELELEAEVPSVHLPKLNPGATVRITRDNAPDLIGRVRLVSPQVDRSSQLGWLCHQSRTPRNALPIEPPTGTSPAGGDGGAMAAASSGARSASPPAAPTS